MKKVVIHKNGSYDNLCIEEHTDLTPKQDEYLIEVEYFGINYADIAIRLGLYESANKFVGLPITPGFEFSGVVKQVPVGSNKYEVGQKVFGVTLFNAYASQVVVPEHQIFPVPENISMAEAAGIPAVFMTAYHALFQNIVFRDHSKVLIHSSAGGVGSSLAQLCRLKKCTTVGIVGRNAKKEYAKSMGCDHVFSKEDGDFWAEIDKLNLDGFDVVLDANGASTLKKSADVLAPCGKLISYGFHSMMSKKGGKINYLKLLWMFLKTPRFNPIFMTAKNISLITFNLSFLFDRTDLFNEAMSSLLKWFESGDLKPLKTTVYDLKDIKQSHIDIESGLTMGKLVIKVTEQ